MAMATLIRKIFHWGVLFTISEVQSITILAECRQEWCC